MNLNNMLRTEICTECSKEFFPTVNYLYRVPGVGSQCKYTHWLRAKEKKEQHTRPKTRRCHENG